jgi:(p)ppGpp synthase/HD superfamily hydrolase
MNTTTKTPYFVKRRIALIHYLAGRNYHNALKAVSFAEQIHQGVRKDGVTPEFQHMLEVALHVITLRDLDDEESTIAAALLHDSREDYGIAHSTMVEQFGDTVANAVEKLSKVIDGQKKSTDFYFEQLSTCPIASLVKGCDRVHNFQSMPGVFSIEKQRSYLKEGRDHFFPMLKQAQRRHTTQFLAYQNVRHHLKNQIELIEHSLLVLDPSTPN